MTTRTKMRSSLTTIGTVYPFTVGPLPSSLLHNTGVRPWSSFYHISTSELLFFSFLPYKALQLQASSMASGDDMRILWPVAVTPFGLFRLRCMHGWRLGAAFTIFLIWLWRVLQHETVPFVFD
jgi:hypothetical protein